MLRCTWGAGVRTWGAVVSGPRGLGAHGLCSGPRAPCPRCLWSRGAEKAPGADLPGRWVARRAESGFALDAGVPQDVLLYEYDRHRAFFSLGFFCLGQAAFWGYLAYIAFDSLPDSAAKKPEEGAEEKKRRTFPLLVGIEDIGSFNKWRIGFTGSCLAAGILIVGSAYLFSRRSVSRILLHQGGQAVSMTTYYPFGFTSTFTVPLHQVSCSSHRSQARAMIPVKVKNKSFYYLVDKQGQFLDATLFDFTVGAYRQL